MKKVLIIIIALVCALCSLTLIGCGSNNDDLSTNEVYQIENGGFETGDLTGWTIEGGDAFSNDTVASKTTFTFKDDVNENKININKVGNWHLYGKAFDDSYSSVRKGSIRSSNFILRGDGTISFKLAGGATMLKGENGAKKDLAKLCYFGVFLAEDNLMIAQQTNTGFLEHTTSYVNPEQYAGGVYFTDNYYSYTLDLKDYIGKELYIKIVDNDDSYYYGYLSVDDIRTHSESKSQDEGVLFTKVKEYTDEVVVPDNDVANGGFETGSLAGWTVVSGEAFSSSGVNAEYVWWNEHITYNRDGKYHYGMFNPSAIGVMRSNTFTLSGSGYISYKLGGGKDGNLTYIRIMQEKETRDVELARLTNYKFIDMQFPHVANGMKLANMVQYYSDLSQFLGAKIYFEVVDNNASNDEMGSLVMDSFKALHEAKPVYQGEAFDNKLTFQPVTEDEILPEHEDQILNGGFETGDLTGWSIIEGRAFTNENVLSSNIWFDKYSYNRKGDYHYSGMPSEGETGVMHSSTFTVNGSGYMTFLMGGNGGYISVVEAGSNRELKRMNNSGFKDVIGWKPEDINVTTFLANMIAYKADLNDILGKEVYLKVVDNAISNWGFIALDSVVTYNENQPTLGREVSFVANKISLYSIYDEYINMVQGDYTSESFALVKTYLAQAKTILDDYASTNAQINTCYSNLQSSISALTLRVPSALQGNSININILQGSSKTIKISEYVNDNKLALSYSLNADTVTVGSITDGTFTVSGNAGSVELIVKYKDTQKLSITFNVSVIPYTAPTASDAEAKIDVYKIIDTKFSINLAQYVTNTLGLDLTYEISIGVGCISSNYTVDGAIANLSLSQESTVQTIITVKASDEYGGVVEFNLTVKFYDTTANRLVNGGFETGNLNGWTVESGDVFGNQMVRNDDFFFADTSYGKDVDGSYIYTAVDHGVSYESRTGVMRSSTYHNISDFASFMIGGGERGDFMYISLMDADTNQELARYVNEDVLGGVLRKYYIDTSNLKNRNLYFRIVDNDKTAWGLFVLDSFESYHESMPSGKLLTNVLTNYRTQVVNGGFEEGNLSGWATYGDAFIDDMVRGADIIGFFNENRPYNKQGDYHFSSFDHGAPYEYRVGAMRSSAFMVAGSGYISYFLGGGGNQNEIVLNVYQTDGVLLATYSNRAFGRRYLYNGVEFGIEGEMTPYAADLSAFMNKTVYIEIVDNSTNGWGIVTFDDLATYHENMPSIVEDADIANTPSSEVYITEIRRAVNKYIAVEDSRYQVFNGKFESGGLEGWTRISGTTFGEITNSTGYWSENISYEKDGEYLFSGMSHEGGTGVLRSKNFILRANGNVSFKIGAAPNPTTYLRFVNAATGEVLGKFINTEFNKHNGNEGRLMQYVYQFSNMEELSVYVEIVDEATNNWGLINVDSIITDYTSAPSFDQMFTAINQNN